MNEMRVCSPGLSGDYGSVGHVSPARPPSRHARHGHLQERAGVEDNDEGRDTSRVLPVSMVARALRPGCHYRFVVIFEGDENIGKTALVRALATDEWYVEMALNLETKEAHMMLQGVWIAEFSELNAYSKTEEARMKGFITLHEDSYIPKFSNFRDKAPRRAIFIGTTNEETYLKGLTGNTRYLPIRLPNAVDIATFVAMREQLFAEAKAHYLDHELDWWRLSDAALAIAQEEREKRRLKNPYEEALAEWLDEIRFTQRPLDEFGELYTFKPNVTSWQEIARYFLKLETLEKWKDKNLQAQIADALKALGYHSRPGRIHGKITTVWRKED
jgi:predicted P-loop ATPase